MNGRAIVSQWRQGAKVSCWKDTRVRIHISGNHGESIKSHLTQVRVAFPPLKDRKDREFDAIAIPARYMSTVHKLNAGLQLDKHTPRACIANAEWLV